MELLHRSPLKKDHPIVSDPTLVFFDTGVNGEGYWNCSHAKIQFEDVVDALYVVYPGHDFLFLFDHSSGHIKSEKFLCTQFETVSKNCKRGPYIVVGTSKSHFVVVMLDFMLYELH